MVNCKLLYVNCFAGKSTVIISSIDYGLFIVQPDWVAIEALVQSRTTYAEQKRTRPIIAAKHGSTCPKIVESRTCSAPVFC